MFDVADFKISSFRTLVIILMRLLNDGTKNELPVVIEETISLAEKVKQSNDDGLVKYKLSGVINHSGQTTKEGTLFFYF
jgi:hypothetical protein